MPSEVRYGIIRRYDDTIIHKTRQQTRSRPLTTKTAAIDTPFHGHRTGKARRTLILANRRLMRGRAFLFRDLYHTSRKKTTDQSQECLVIKKTIFAYMATVADKVLVYISGVYLGQLCSVSIPSVCNRVYNIHALQVLCISNKEVPCPCVLFFCLYFVIFY